MRRAGTEKGRQMATWLLTALGGLSLLGYFALLRLNAINGVAPVLTFLALLGVLFLLYALAWRVIRNQSGPQPRVLLVIAVGAVLFRLALLPAGLPHDADPGQLLKGLRDDVTGKRVSYERFQLYDDDLWRYLWDGHAWAHGFNPYLNAPAEAAVESLTDDDLPALTDQRPVWSDVRDNINYPTVRTIYPPLPQAVFRFSHALAPGSVLVLKSLLVVFDLLAAVFLALTLSALGRPTTWVLLYAWNPLVIKVFAGSGHMDAIVVAALAATTYLLVRHRRTPAALVFGLAILSKLVPIVLAPLLIRRIGWRRTLLVPPVVLLGYLPFLSAGPALFEGLFTFARDWQFNAGPHNLLLWLAGFVSANPALLARALCGLAIVAVLAWLVRLDDARPESFAAFAAGALGALLVLSPTVMPWYATWLLPLAIIARQRIWLYFSGLVCLAFLVMIDGTERPWVLALEYAGFFSLLAYERARNRVSFPQREPLPVAVPAGGN
jgi:hypothetical protein